MIATLILVEIGIQIGSIEFLDNGAPDVVFNPDKKIQKGLIQLLLKEFMQY